MESKNLKVVMGICKVLGIGVAESVRTSTLFFSFLMVAVLYLGSPQRSSLPWSRCCTMKEPLLMASFTISPVASHWVRCDMVSGM